MNMLRNWSNLSPALVKAFNDPRPQSIWYTSSPIFSADEIPVLLGTGGGPAWTPRVMSAFSGNAASVVGGADRHDDTPNAAPPTAVANSASADRLETCTGSAAPDDGTENFVDVADATVERVAALENFRSTGCQCDEFG